MASRFDAPKQTNTTGRLWHVVELHVAILTAGKLPPRKRQLLAEYCLFVNHKNTVRSSPVICRSTFIFFYRQVDNLQSNSPVCRYLSSVGYRAVQVDRISLPN